MSISHHIHNFKSSRKCQCNEEENEEKIQRCFFRTIFCPFYNTENMNNSENGPPMTKRLFKERHVKKHKLQTKLLSFMFPGSLMVANIPAATQARRLRQHHPWFLLLLNLQINQASNIFLPKKSQTHAHHLSSTISLAYCDTFLWFHYWWYFSSSNHNEKELPEWSIKI